MEILEYVKEKIANKDLTIAEVKRAIDREYKLKTVDRTKPRETGATSLLRELIDLKHSCVVKKDDEYIYDVNYSYDGIKTLNKKYNNIMDKYTDSLNKDVPTLSRTTIWRVTKEFAEYVIKELPDENSKDRERIRKVFGLRDYI